MLIRYLIVVLICGIRSDKGIKDARMRNLLQMFRGLAIFEKNIIFWNFVTIVIKVACKSQLRF